jgi:hypothetical protein
VNSLYVRFGSLANICSAKGLVRFTPDGDHESGHVPVVMSALPPKADMCSAIRNVRSGPIADIGNGQHSGAFEKKHHILVACTFFPKRLQGLYSDELYQVFKEFMS